MLLKKLCKLGKDLRRDWFERAGNKECYRLCKYYNSYVCGYYKPGCVWFLKHLPLGDYRYIPYQHYQQYAEEEGNSNRQA